MPLVQRHTVAGSWAGLHNSRLLWLCRNFTLTWPRLGLVACATAQMGRLGPLDGLFAAVECG